MKREERDYVLLENSRNLKYMKSREMKKLAAGECLVRKEKILGSMSFEIGSEEEECGADDGGEDGKESCLKRRKILKNSARFEGEVDILVEMMKEIDAGLL